MNLKINKKNDKANGDYDCIIIGGGPSGLTAGIYLGRARLKTLIIEEMIAGGQAASTHLIENYTGFVDGIGGMDLGSRMEQQALKFGSQIVYEKVIDVDFGKIKKIKTEKKEYTAKAVIISSGANPRKINALNADKFHGKGISYCATCDGPLFKNKNIVIIGGGNSAIEEAIFLERYVKSITIVQDLEFLTAEKILQERLLKHDNIVIHKGYHVEKINGENRIESITIKNIKTKENIEINTDGVFVYIGYVPKTDFLKDKIKLNKYGYIETDNELKTNVEGVFAAGDVIDKTLRQVATAVGDGSLAAFIASHYIENL